MQTPLIVFLTLLVFSYPVYVRAEIESFERFTAEKCAHLQTDIIKLTDKTKELAQLKCMDSFLSGEKLQPSCIELEARLKKELNHHKPEDGGDIPQGIVRPDTLLQGNLLKYNNKETLEAADIALIGYTSWPGHLVAIERKGIGEGPAFYRIHHAIFDLVGNDSIFESSIVQETGSRVFRFKNAQLKENFVSVLKKLDAEKKKKYSVTKALKSFFDRGQHPASEKEKNYFTSELIKQLLWDDEAIRNRFPATALASDRKEICSSYVGNALVVGYLKTKTRETPVLKDAIKKLKEGAQKQSPSPEEATKLIAQTAETLLHATEFRRSASLDTSPLFAVTINRMLPSDILRFFIQEGGAPCATE